jgi:hypothetical protein
VRNLASISKRTLSARRPGRLVGLESLAHDDGRRSESSRLSEAVVTPPCDYQVVDHIDVQHAAGLDHCAGELRVLGTGIGVARWVVVANDYRTRLGRYRRSEHLTASTKRVDSSRHCHLSGSGPQPREGGASRHPPGHSSAANRYSRSASSNIGVPSPNVSFSRRNSRNAASARIRVSHPKNPD